MLDYDGEKWSENAESARIFMSKYEDEIVEARLELQGLSRQTDRRRLQAKIDALEKARRSFSCVQVIFDLPGRPIIYRDGVWGFYKQPQKSAPQQSTFMATAGFIKKSLFDFSRAFASVGNELTQTFAELVDSIPTTMNEMFEEAPIPPECKPARKLTDDLGAFIRSLPAPPITKDNILVLAEKLGCVLKLGIKPECELWDWIASYGKNKQFNTQTDDSLSFKKCVGTLVTASIAFSDKNEMFIKFITCAIK